MLTKPVPTWIKVGGFTLAMMGGCINAVGLLCLQKRAVSHMSGTITTIGIDLASHEYSLARAAALIVVFFFLGSVLSGLIIRQSTLKAGRRYGAALIGEAVLLLIATYLLRHGSERGLFVASMACGLQNGMATSYSGAVIRTTHVTGVITDLGIAIGLTARGLKVDWRRMRLYIILLTGFLSGGVLGGVRVPGSWSGHPSDTCRTRRRGWHRLHGVAALLALHSPSFGHARRLARQSLQEVTEGLRYPLFVIRAPITKTVSHYRAKRHQPKGGDHNQPGRGSMPFFRASSYYCIGGSLISERIFIFGSGRKLRELIQAGGLKHRSTSNLRVSWRSSRFLWLVWDSCPFVSIRGYPLRLRRSRSRPFRGQPALGLSALRTTAGPAVPALPAH